ncbi:MAG: hypothetical protein QOF49_1916 [Chloroflexota bacterium]|jgi:hypothetical protein|nr:hypothetical protein [Chloroflexota bacterium]
MTNLTPARPRPAAVVVAAAMFALGIAAGCLPPVSRGGPAAGSSAAVSGGPSAALSTGPAGPTPRRSFVAPTATPAPTFAVYVVKSGDNLNAIGKRFGTTAHSIALWNRSTYPSLDPESAAYRPDVLKLGWTLFLIPNVTLGGDDAPALPAAAPTVAPTAS